MSPPRLITLLTDFGLDDGYVAAMKGVIATRAPDARVIDICHTIAPQDLRRAGLVWASAVDHFPAGTVHVAVVDPGVGTARRALGFRARGAYFLVPDNGLIGYVLSGVQGRTATHLSRAEHFCRPVSSTFHGRDIFAPVAAELAKGAPLNAFGPIVRRFQRAALPRTLRRRQPDGRVVERGEIIYCDRFGNAFTNLRPGPHAQLIECTIGAVTLGKLSRTYGDVRRGEPVLLVGSTGYMEIAVREGNAAEKLSVRLGTQVRAVWRAAGRKRVRGE